MHFSGEVVASEPANLRATHQAVGTVLRPKTAQLGCALLPHQLVVSEPALSQITPNSATLAVGILTMDKTLLLVKKWECV
jgi:hypothetical protein